MLRKGMKLFGSSILVLFELLLIYVICIFNLPMLHHNTSNSQEKEITIYLANNGVHTDFIVPVKNEFKDWSLNFNSNDAHSPVSNVKYLKIGWGDSKIYFDTPAWSDLTASTTLTAMCGMNPSVVKVQFIKKVIESDRCVSVKISHEQYKKLVNYIENSVKEEKSIINPIIPKVYGSNCAFYPGKGKLSMFKVCNSWVNKGLYEADLPSCFWTARYEPIFELYQS